jgi:hypothetical protein
MVERDTFRAVLVDLHFSPRVLRPAVGLRKFRCTLRALLTGEYEDAHALPPLPVERVLAHWRAEGDARQALEHWIAFDASLGAGQPLARPTPPALLAAASALAARHGVVRTAGRPRDR